MFNPRKPSRSTPQRPTTPLDLKQKALIEKEEQLRQASEQLQRLIEDAPRRKEENTRRRRAKLASDTRLSRSALVERRYDATTTADASFGHRRLRSEKKDGKWLFLILSIVFAALIIFVARLALMHF